MPAIVTSGEGWNEWRPHGAPIVSIDDLEMSTIVVRQAYRGPMSSPFLVQPGSPHPDYVFTSLASIERTKPLGAGGLGEIVAVYQGLPDVLSGTGIQSQQDIEISVTNATVYPKEPGGDLPALGAIAGFDFFATVYDTQHLRGSYDDTSANLTFSLRASESNLSPGKLAGTINGTISARNSTSRFFTGTLIVTSSTTILGETTPLVSNPVDGRNPLTGAILTDPFSNRFHVDGRDIRNEYQTYSYRYPELRFSATEKRPAETKSVTARVGIAVFQVTRQVDRYGTTTFANTGVIPTIPPTRFLVGSSPVNYLRDAYTVNGTNYADTDPTATQYFTAIGSGFEMVAASTVQSDPRMRGVYIRRTIYVPIL